MMPVPSRSRGSSRTASIPIYEDHPEDDLIQEDVEHQDNVFGPVIGEQDEEELIADARAYEYEHDTSEHENIHDVSPHDDPENDYEDHYHDQHVAAEDDSNEEDPFSSSELSDPTGDIVLGQRGSIVKSIEADPSAFSSHGYDRSFSSTTAIHFDEHLSPHLEEDSFFPRNENIEEEYGEDQLDSDFATDFVQHVDRTKPSETMSMMPEDDMDSAYNHGTFQRSPLLVSKSHYPHSAQSSRPPSNAAREGYLSSPNKERYYRAFPANDVGGTTPSRQYSDMIQHPRSTSERPVFRNPSSVRAMQMSSPSPSSHAVVPMDVNLRRPLDANRLPVRTSTNNTPARHVDPRKEYPLILLHCTLHAETHSKGDFSALDRSVCSPVEAHEIQQDVATFNEKLTRSVLERGILIPHPGEDYELLEERVLESLELERPRLGPCGHFLSDTIADDVAQSGSHTCPDCNRRISPRLTSKAIHGTGRTQRWNVRVFAANGLMRAGAWGAAWREMEKVDVEVGVWMPEAVRRALEAQNRNQKRSENQSSPKLTRRDSRPLSPLATRRSIARDINSSPMPSSPGDVARNRPKKVSIDSPSKKSVRHKSEISSGSLPISTLLVNYIKRIASEQQRILLPVVLALMLLWFISGFISGATSSGNPVEAATSNAAAAVQPLLIDVTNGGASMAQPLSGLAETDMINAYIPWPGNDAGVEQVLVWRIPKSAVSSHIDELEKVDEGTRSTLEKTLGVFSNCGDSIPNEGSNSDKLGSVLDIDSADHDVSEMPGIIGAAITS